MAFSPTHRPAWALLLAAGVLAPGAAVARPDKDNDGPTLKISGSVRLEAEAIDGQFRPKVPANDTLFSSRTLVMAEADLGPIRLVGELDDARGYGERHGSSASTSEINALEPLQGYLAVKVGNLGGTKGSGDFAIGRFTMDIGTARLVGRPDASNSPPSYLGARFDWKSKAGDRIIAFVTRPFERLPVDADDLRDNKVQLDRESKGLTFWGASVTKANVAGKVATEGYGYWLAEKDTPGRDTKDRHLFTFGGRVFRAASKGKLDFELEVARQHGRTRATTAASDVTDRTVRATTAHVEAGMTLEASWSPRVVALADYASGDGPAATYGRFDPLFAARRADFNPTGLYGPISRANLISAGLGLEGKPSKKLDFFVKSRLLWLAEPTDSFASTSVRDKTGASGDWAGVQIEARVRDWIVDKKIRWEGGAAYLAKGRFLKDAPNAPQTGDTTYGYTTLSFFF
ncbi:alginate export family protein [Sphingomonas sp.]|uniref:alginate export family protein n=1 Tax=Sphingomonas sp. TaxID=28214 RepID=UPI001AFF8CD7|nr:alginate export family protein [Sphingomonas sp.]MBO9713855.1 alginate export family protein [Sphingomonas sp.]